MDRIEIEQEFMSISSSEVESGKKRFRDAMRDINESLPENNIYSDFQPQTLRDSAGENFGFASEHFLKSNIIFDDFSRSPLFTQPTSTNMVYRNKEILCPGIGTPEWRIAIAGESDEKKLQILSDPKLILSDIIKVNNPNDPRNIITNDDRFNADFLTLKLSGSAPKGHSLYAYYQLQHPVVKSLINSEFFTYVEEEFNYTIYALLTDDILKKDSGTILMPRNLMEKLDSVKAASVNLRYASISGKNISEEELKFLREFTSSLLNVSEYRFPLQKKYSSLEFDKYNFDNFSEKNNADFVRLDKMQKYYLQSNFSSKELISLKEYIHLLRKNGVSQIDIDIFIGISIYFKNYVNNVLKINLIFETEQFSRIFNFCNVVKAYQPFDAQNKRFCDNPAFGTLEKRKTYITEIKEKQQQTKEKDEKTPEIVNIQPEKIIKNISKLDESEIKKILQQINVNDWISLGYTYTQFINMIRKHPALLSYDINTIKEKLDKMTSLGYQKEHIIKMTSFCPQIIDYGIEHLIRKIDELVNLGYSKEQALKLLLKFSILFSLPKGYAEKKINQLISLGYNKDEIIKMTEKYPSLFALNIDNVGEKKKFYDKIGISKKIIENANLMMQSIELSYARYMFYKSIGITIDEENYKLLFMSQTNFQKLYNINNYYLMEEFGKSNDSEDKNKNK